MNKVKFDSEVMKVIAAFQGIARVDVKDCIVEPEKIVFIVGENQGSRAVGKQGIYAKQMEKAFNRKIKIVEFNSDVLEFAKNLIYPLKAKEVTEKEGIVTITPPDLQTRGYLIGRSATTLRSFERLIKRHFPITELKVI